jgi:hypothetical protein
VALVSLTFSHSLVVTAPTNDQYLSTKQREEKKPIISSTLINIHLSQSSDLFIPYLQKKKKNNFSQNQSNHIRQMCRSIQVCNKKLFFSIFG